MIFRLAIFLILLPSLSIAAPAVTGVSGTVSNGESITISGTDFGSTGPTIILFDDFEAGTNGSRIGDGATSARVGSWRDSSAACDPNYYSVYSTGAAHSGSQSAYQDWGAAPSPDGGAMWFGLDIGTPSTQWYISYWVYVPAGSDIPGYGEAAGTNWKLWWLSTDDLYGSDYGVQIINNDSPMNMAYGPIDGGEDRCSTGDYIASTFAKGRWTRMEFLLVGATDTSGAIYGWLTDSVNARSLWASDDSDNTLYSAGATGWRYLKIPGYARLDDDADTYYDDIYVATGSGARARVEICNNATYSSATNCAISTPTSWGATSVTATVRQGSFGASDNAYLFVIDSTGAASSGYAVTFGAGGETPPSRKLNNVTGVRVTLH